MEILIGIVFLLILIKKITTKPLPEKDIYCKKNEFLSPAEKKFFFILNHAVGEECFIFSKVRIADLLETERKENARKNQGSFNKISAKHVDFVLLPKKNCNVTCAIELDDKSHNRANRIKRDQFLEEAFKTARLPLVRFKCQARYSSKEVREKLSPYLN